MSETRLEVKPDPRHPLFEFQVHRQPMSVYTRRDCFIARNQGQNEGGHGE